MRFEFLPSAVELNLMTAEKICEDAAQLSLQGRTQVVLSLLDTMGSAELQVSDEEANGRLSELESGAVPEMTHEEFLAGLDLNLNS